MAATTTIPNRGPKDAVDVIFRKSFKWSLSFHVGLLVFVLIKSLVFPDQPIRYIPALRVDIVGLPDIMKKDLMKIPPVSTEKLQEELKEAADAAKDINPNPMHPPPPEPLAEPDEMVLKPKPAVSTAAKTKLEREKKMKSALARMKALAKITPDEPEAPSSVLVKGNQISKGTSLSGEARQSAEASYYDLVRERLHENWELPVWLSRQNLSAQVDIFIDNKGKVRTFRFMKLSGNAQFDDAVKKTIQASEPFPRPPTELTNTLLTHGVAVGFPL